MPLRVFLFPQIASLHVQHIVTVIAHLIDPRGDTFTVDITQLGDAQVAGHHRGSQLVVPVTQYLVQPVREPVAAAGMLGAHVIHDQQLGLFVVPEYLPLGWATIVVA